MVLACSLTSPAFATPTREELREEADRALELEIEKAAPALMPTLKEADQARRAENWHRAAALYEKVREGAPGASGAARRLCGVERERHNWARALDLCREAAKDESADNLTALASTLLEAPSREPRLDEAQQLIDRALALKPSDVWAVMTLCHIQLARKQLDAAEKCIQQLNERMPDEVIATLYAHEAHLLIDSNQIEKAQEIVRRAALMGPREPSVHSARCALSLSTQKAALLADCAEQLRTVAPSAHQTYLYSAIERATLGNFSEADDYLDQALAKGAPPAAVAGLRAKIADARPWYSKWLTRASVVLAGWAIGLAVLFGVGVLLSASALRAARTPPSERSGRASGMSAFLRAAYSAVLWLCCGYYYLSIPIVVLLVLALAAVPVVGMLALGYIAPKLFFIAGFLVLVTLSAIAKGLFVRTTSQDPGMRLEFADYPALRDVLVGVAAKVGTRPVDSVFMTPDTSVAVFERGGLLMQLRGKGERCLMIGAGVLEGMPLDQLRAILAHEYGHFSNRDTAGGGVALAVRRSLVLTTLRLAHSGAASRWNPAWLFVTGYYRLFLRISLGASRLQEVLADRWAAFTYGTENFVEGLKHVVRRSVEFDRHVEATVKELATTRAGLVNLYRHVPQPDQASPRSLDEAVEEAICRLSTPYDSHPSPKERIELVRRSGADARVDAADRERSVNAWSLFPNREELERKLTAEFCSNVYESTGLEFGHSTAT
jgi:Zn-dependent protease with chaperone function/tetratricopeptide (TPR) repeat protein